MNKEKKQRSWRRTLVLLIGLISLAVIGCEPLMDEFWPCITNKPSRSYLKYEDPNRAIVSLAKAEEMREDIIITHRDYLLEQRRNIEDDENAFQDALLIDDRIAESQQYKRIIVGDAGNPMSIAGLLAGTSFAGLIGSRYVKRTGDSSPDEVKVLVTKAVDEEKQKNGSGAAKKT